MESQFFGIEFENITREWKAKQNDKGVIYYMNTTKQTTSWNHPYLYKILADLVTYRNIKYAAYRASFKLRYLQSHIGLHWITIPAVRETFAGSTELTNMRLSHSEALPLIQNVLHISDEHRTEEDIRKAADLILNLMMNLYDVDRCGKICIRSLRNALITMCCARLAEKYQYFFTSVSSEDQNVSKEKLFFLIEDLIQIPFAIKEGESFGRNVAGTVDSCFKAGDPLTGKVNIECFYRWLTKEPQTLVWLPTFHRVLATETVEHSVCCSVCGSVRIIGLRYRCLQCVKYELCQSCFLQGLTSLSHKLKHPVREYCLPTSIKDNTKALLEILRNKLRRNHSRPTKTAYLPVKPLTVDGALTNGQPGSIHDSIASASGSVDSGLAIGIDQQDADIEEPGVKRCNQTSEILGKPCSTSSPCMRACDQELVMLPRKDTEIHHQRLEQQIEQLKTENRALQSKLNLIYKYCDAELTNELSAIDTYGPWASFDSLSKDLIKETMDTSVSPIVNNSITSISSLIKRQVPVENEQSSNVNVDIRHIIGILTPVRHTNLTAQTSQLSHNHNELSSELQTLAGRNDPSEQNELSAESQTLAGQSDFFEQNELSSKLHTLARQSDSSDHNELSVELQTFFRQNESSVPDGLAYGSADMSLSLDSTEDKGSQGNPDFHVSRTSLVQSVLSSGLVDTLCDITLGYSAKPNEGISERERCLQPQSKAAFTRANVDQVLKNCSDSSPYSSKFTASNIVNTKLQLRKTSEKRQTYLVYSSSDMKSKPDVNSSEADFSCNSDSFSNSVANDDQNPLAVQSNTTDNDDMMSEISEDSRTRSRNPTPSPTMHTFKQKMMGQVIMSTPISNSEHVTTRNFLRKQFRTMSLPWPSDADKENITDPPARRKSKHSQSISSIDTSHLSATSSHRTSARHKSKCCPFEISDADKENITGQSARHKSEHSQSISSIDTSHLSATSSRRTSARHKSEHSQSISSIDTSHLSATSSHRTSARHKSEHSQSTSSIDMSHLSATSSLRQGTLTPADSLLSGHSLNSNDVVTEHGSGTGNLSDLFRKAAHIWDIASDNVPGTGVTNGDVLERRMLDFKKECTSDECFHGGK
ncbi:hypothetical protein BsWGS_02818 [Bradybaena similaris]